MIRTFTETILYNMEREENKAMMPVRLASLDALRGFDMMFIIGVASLVIAVCNLFPGGENCWLATQMDHVEWNGWHHHDTIFPLFLFIAGISFPFSYAKQKEKGTGKGAIYWKIFRRALILIAFGLLCNGFFKFKFDTIRFYSVLARIGVAWMFGALLFINFKSSTRAIIAAALLLGYWFLCMIPAPDVPGADPLSQDGCLVGYIDRCLLPGHLYNGNFDPEGLLSTIPAIVTAMLGMFTGEFVRGDLTPKRQLSENRKVLLMFAAAALFLGLGYLWSIWFPINKKLWTSSFVLVLAAFSLASFALFYWIIDVKGWKKWSFPFQVIGMNSITIFMAPRIIDFNHARDFFLSGTMALCPEQYAKVIGLAGALLLKWLFLYFLYKKRIFLRV